jgi:hypothetical protein
VLWSNHFCYDEAKNEVFFASYKYLRDLCENYFCYNYINILLRAIYFYSITTTYRIGGPNKTRMEPEAGIFFLARRLFTIDLRSENMLVLAS